MLEAFPQSLVKVVAHSMWKAVLLRFKGLYCLIGESTPVSLTLAAFLGCLSLPDPKVVVLLWHLGVVKAQDTGLQFMDLCVPAL